MASLASYSIPIHVHFEGAFHLGTGRAEGLIQRTLRQAADGRPYLPGSALKGALRQTAARLTYRLDRVAREIDAAPDEYLGTRRRGTKVLSERCQAPRPQDMCQSAEPCLVCRVFGNVFTGPRLTVDDAYAADQSPFDRSLQALLQGTSEAVPDASDQNEKASSRFKSRVSAIDTVTRIQIDQRRKGTKQGALFTSEYSQPAAYASQLSGTMPLTPVPDHDIPIALVLLAASVAACDQIGAEASTGHGQCRIEGPDSWTVGPNTYKTETLLSEEIFYSLIWRETL